VHAARHGGYDSSMDSSVFAAVQQALADLDFPASKDAIVRHAQDRSAAEAALRLLKALPLATYRSISEIRSSVPLDPAAEDGQTASQKADQVRSRHSKRIAEHLRDTG
jgi:Protein of unknown function (DUF2795)